MTTTDTACPCGSGNPRYELIDEAGTFCAFICAACADRVLARYRPDIFDPGHPYARSGDEQDLA